MKMNKTRLCVFAGEIELPFPSGVTSSSVPFSQSLRLSASQPLYLCLSLSPTSLEASAITLNTTTSVATPYSIDTDKDVDLLLEKGILKSWIWQPANVAQMVNKLVTVILDPGSYYYDIAGEVNKSSSVCISVTRGQGQPPSALRFYWR
ncbi:hypothetical protein HID58_046910 [Brassica napus]|uniref:Uncharacterized protein n=1 Tax=Brassica napus TaxID=3708 RepID=A0ABQ8AXV0_BRANA|nr:hypothetical protein HID58_046910 [Brassica napus]